MNTKQNSAPKARARSKIGLELLIVAALATAVYILAARYDILECVVEFSRQHENWEIDEIMIVSLFLVVALTFHLFRQWRKVLISEDELLHKNEELQKAFSEIRQLRGIIPICASCKKIRDDKGFWQQVEVYVRDRTEAEFSHGICPDCERKLYPDSFEDEVDSEDKSS